ncbi:MAG: BatD family protein [Halioglobus sp.]
MKAATKRYCVSLFLTCLTMTGTNAFSSSLKALQDSGRLQLGASLSKVNAVVPGEQIKMTLEIATDRWFAGGTRIEVPEVAGLVILQTENFASNSSEMREGKNWVIQRWTLDVYAQQEGIFTIPPISARIKVSEAGGAILEGQVTGPTLEFVATRPESLLRATAWVAAPSFSVTQTFDRDLNNLVIGDAIQRKIRFEAEDVMAMMLPTFDEAPMQGLTRYSEPPVLQNSSNRGTTLASREVTLTYIVEALGEYHLPAQEYFWWDTLSEELELISLPTVNVQVGTGPSKPSGGEKPDYRQIGLWIATALLILLGMAWIRTQSVVSGNIAQIKKHWNRLLRRWRRLRQPALARTLNPGNNSED